MPSTRVSLRSRVTLAYTLLGLVLSLLFIGAVELITEDYEDVLVEEILKGQADDYSARLAANPALALPQTRRLSGFRRPPGGQGDIPDGFARLTPGIHELGGTRNGIHVGVFDTSAGRLVFVVDLRDIEKLETHLAWFLAAMLVLGTATAAWLGWLFAGRTVAPVARLADAVDRLSAEPQATDLAAAVSHDELGRLASAIDRYQARLVEADRRERAFYADASHELRTPIAVVRGAADVLLDEPGIPAADRRVLYRIDRGMQELTELLDVLLGIARRTELRPETIEARELLAEAVVPMRLEQRPLDVTIEAEGMMFAPRAESVLLLRSIIRRLLALRPNPCVHMTLDGNLLEIAVGGSDTRITPAGSAGPSDSGLSTGLLDRLAQRLGWRIDLADGRARCLLPHASLANGAPLSTRLEVE